MTDTTKTIERLQELLDAKDMEIAGLRDECRGLRRVVDDDPYSFAFRDEPSASALPVPRLEIEWTPDEEWGWGKATAVYRLVYRHFSGNVVSIGIGRTVQTGSRGEAPINGANWKHRPGKIALPHRDGAHICHDMAHLSLPGFAICGEQVDDLSDLVGNPHAR